MIKSIDINVYGAIQTKISYEEFIIESYHDISTESGLDIKKIVNVIAQRYEKVIFLILDIIVKLYQSILLAIQSSNIKQLLKNLDKERMMLPTETARVKLYSMGKPSIDLNQTTIKLDDIMEEIEQTIGIINRANVDLDKRVNELMDSKDGSSTINKLKSVLTEYDKAIFSSPIFSNIDNFIESDGSIYNILARRSIMEKVTGDPKYKFIQEGFSIDGDVMNFAHDRLKADLPIYLKHNVNIINKSINALRVQIIGSKLKTVASVGMVLNGSQSNPVELIDGIQSMYRSIHIHKLTMINMLQAVSAVYTTFMMKYIDNCMIATSAKLEIIRRTK